MKHIIPFIVMIVFVIAVAIVIIHAFNFKLKKRIIESGNIDENALKFLDSISGVNSEALKWGLILLFGGIGLVVIELLPYYSEDSPLPYGIESIFLAIGFLAYYLLVRKKA
ncbi:hypothetical protein FFF34_005215 [Inquilinus sp. KBS0705]|nr:hypothetical protein FFF34_005215 [Inquilinus sp. KBS0705]